MNLTKTQTNAIRVILNAKHGAPRLYQLPDNRVLTTPLFQATVGVIFPEAIPEQLSGKFSSVHLEGEVERVSMTSDKAERVNVQNSLLAAKDIDGVSFPNINNKNNPPRVRLCSENLEGVFDPRLIKRAIRAVVGNKSAELWLDAGKLTRHMELPVLYVVNPVDVCDISAFVMPCSIKRQSQ